MFEDVAKGFSQLSDEWHETDDKPFGCAFWALLYVVSFIAVGFYVMFTT